MKVIAGIALRKCRFFCQFFVYLCVKINSVFFNASLSVIYMEKLPRIPFMSIYDLQGKSHVCI